MKVICISIGTRGDIEPFASLTQTLCARGHDVICAYPAQFEKLAKETGGRFFPLKKEFLEMLDSSSGRTALGGGMNLWSRLGAYYGLYKQNKRVSFELLQQQKELIEKEKPDLILHSLKAFYPIYWHLHNPGKVVLVSPIPCVIHAVEEMSSIFLNGKNYGRFLNRKSYGLMRNLSMRFFRNQLKRLDIHASQSELDRSFVTEKLLYTISPTLYPERVYWPENVKVLGYLERDKAMHWTPPEALTSFLNRNPEPLFVTFGSMTNPDPAGKTDYLHKILEKHQIPAIINTASGGLEEPAAYNREQFHYVRDIPYDWIFPRVKAVIHHGGAGTTHLALKYGCASMIIPHIPDQHLWNRIVRNLEAGPKGPSIRRFEQDETEDKVTELYHGDNFRKAARTLSKHLRQEDYTNELIAFLQA